MSRLLAQGIILIQILKQDRVFSYQETLTSLEIDKTFRKFIGLNQRISGFYVNMQLVR